MSNLLHLLEDTAARGAEGLTPEARVTLAAALRALQCPEGGFAGLDGRPDPYFSLFAWLSLRALGAAYDRDRLCVYLAARRHDPNAVNALCADLVLACEGQRHPFSRLKWLAALLRGDARAAYGAFLAMLATGRVPSWAARAAWRRQRSLFGAAAALRLPTPRLAAGLVLATMAGGRGTGIVPALEARRCAHGGFVSAPGALPDVLATAAARFAIDFEKASAKDCGRKKEEPTADLVFIEACWTEDGLFGASPTAARGDAEHTFYGLLALGTCRRPGPSAGSRPDAAAERARGG